jgi:hypothetical protein
MENTVESILSHGDKSPQELIETLKSGASNAATATALDEQLARALSQGQKASSRSNSANRSASSSTPSGAGGTASSSSSSNQNDGRGTPTTLPDDFLRLPGRKYSNNNATTSSSSAAAAGAADGGGSESNLEADEALARMLQDELFSEELARNPDFAHLAGRRPQRTSQSQTAGVTRSNVWTGPGFPARNGPGQPQPLPNIMGKLSGTLFLSECCTIQVFIYL